MSSSFVTNLYFDQLSYEPATITITRTSTQSGTSSTTSTMEHMRHSHRVRSGSPESDDEADLATSFSELFQYVQYSFRKASRKFWKVIRLLGPGISPYPIRQWKPIRRLPSCRGLISASPERRSSSRGHPARPPSPPRSSPRSHPARPSSPRRVAKARAIPTRTRTIWQQNKIHVGSLLGNDPGSDWGARGILRDGNQCYRLAPLQALLHLPRFVNLIRQHNSRGSDGSLKHPHRTKDDFEADRYDDPRLDPRNFDDRLAKDHPELKACPYCPACIMKTVSGAYWHRPPLGTPYPPPLRHNRPSMRLFHGLTDLRSQPNADGTLRQDDANFCWQKILEACYHCADDEASDEWHELFKALFQVQFKTTRSCTVCERSRDIPQSDEHYLGLDNINIKLDGPENIENAIDRVMLTHPGEDVPCGIDDDGECEAIGSNIIKKRIEAGPEYLCLPLNLSRQDPLYKLNPRTGEEELVGMTESKNDHPVQFGRFLDLTNKQVNKSTPLLYQLQALLLHTGTLDRGHWTATVRTHDDQILHIDDHRIIQSNWEEMLENPVQWGESTYTAAAVFYTRLPESQQTSDMRCTARELRGEDVGISDVVTERASSSKGDTGVTSDVVTESDPPEILSPVWEDEDAIAVDFDYALASAKKHFG